jgi:hypothetical protein
MASGMIVVTLIVITIKVVEIADSLKEILSKLK